MAEGRGEASDWLLNFLYQVPYKPRLSMVGNTKCEFNNLPLLYF